MALAHIGGVEGYCNLVFCLCEQNFWTTNNIGASIELRNYTRIKIKGRLFLKPFGYKVAAMKMLNC